MLACLRDYPNPIKGLGHGSMTFLMKMPIHVFRQWVRHRQGTTTELDVDFDSIVSKSQFYIPEYFRKQIGKPMQYNFENCNDEENDIIKKAFTDHIRNCKERYGRLREAGTAPRMASMILPYCFYVPVVITYPIDGLLNFFSLRLDRHAQAEIREPAQIIWGMFKSCFPKIADALPNIVPAES